jgi:hypothetical protein
MLYLDRRLYAILFLVVAFSIGSQSRAQNNPYVSWGQGQIADLRSQMRAEMSADELTLDRSIKYRVVDSGVLNAAALVQANHREILISSALLEVIDDYATMDTISGLWNTPQCLYDYGNYISDLYDANTTAISDGGSGNPTQPPFVFIRHHSDVCPQLSPNVILNNDRQSGDIRTGLIRESIKFVLLHEFAHQLNNDSGEVSHADSRKREARADDYAFRKLLVSASDSPLAAVPVLLVFCSLENFGSDNTESDHPTGIARLQAMIDDAKGSEQWKTVWNTASPSERKQIQVALDELEQMQ